MSNGVIESYQYLRRQAKILVRQLPDLPDLFLSRLKCLFGGLVDSRACSEDNEQQA